MMFVYTQIKYSYTSNERETDGGERNICMGWKKTKRTDRYHKKLCDGEQSKISF